MFSECLVYDAGWTQETLTIAFELAHKRLQDKEEL